MSSRKLAVSVRGLSKRYTIAREQSKESTLAETVLKRLRHPFRQSRHEHFYALQDLSFDIARGEVVGIVGRNGAGKSTLLKILSRITAPTSGKIDLYGRVGSLLEVGTGFHPELTGRENIFLNGVILGMRRTQVARQFDAIVDFAGVERFLDTPVKRYSSGMYVRLAFAVAAYLMPEILIVDEVLAVGDAEFQQKCLGKMQDVSSAGRTVLFVSHNMAVVQKLCHRAIFLRQGKVLMDDTALKVVEEYQRAGEGESLLFGRRVNLADTKRWGGNGKARLTSVTLFDPRAADEQERPVRQGDVGLRMTLAGDVRVVKGAGVQITDLYDRKIVNCNTLEHRADLALKPGDEVSIIIRDLRLRPGLYKVGLWLGESEEGHVDVIADNLSLEILPSVGREWLSKHDGAYECLFDHEVVGPLEAATA